MHDIFPVIGDELLQSLGVDNEEMFRVFNMGVGFALVVRPHFVDAIVHRLERMKQTVYRIGHIKRGSGKVELRA